MMVDGLMVDVRGADRAETKDPDDGRTEGPLP